MIPRAIHERIRRIVLDGSLVAGAHTRRGRRGVESGGGESIRVVDGDRYALFSQDHDTLPPPPGQPRSLPDSLSNCLCTRAVFYLACRLPANETPADLRNRSPTVFVPRAGSSSVPRAGPQTPGRSKRAYLNGGNVEWTRTHGERGKTSSMVQLCGTVCLKNWGGGSKFLEMDDESPAHDSWNF